MNVIERAIEALGGQAEAARKLKVTPQAVSQWEKGRRPLPPKRAMRIDELTQGVFSKNLLRPDFFGAPPAMEASTPAAEPPPPPPTGPLNTPEAVAQALASRGTPVPAEGVAPRGPVAPVDPDAGRVQPFVENP